MANPIVDYYPVAVVLYPKLSQIVQVVLGLFKSQVCSSRLLSTAMPEMLKVINIPNMPGNGLPGEHCGLKG